MPNRGILLSEVLFHNWIRRVEVIGHVVRLIFLWQKKQKMAAQLWGKLPSIIIVEILSYLSLTDRLNATTTCRRWRGCLFHPLLWRSITFKVKNGGRRRAKHLADMCGNFVREAVIIFNSRHSGDVRECLRILDFFGENTNLERLVLKPFSCRVEWPDRETRDGRDL